MIAFVAEEASKLNRDPPDDFAMDAMLVQQVAEGDRKALAELYQRHAKTAYSLALRLVGEPAAEDVVHDAFVALVSRKSTFDPARGSFRAWFLTSVHRRCLSVLRRRPFETIEPFEDILQADDPEPVDDLVRRLENEAVRSALERLPSEQREALVLAYYGGLSQSALSGRLGLPLGTVKSRMRRGMLSMRGMLAADAAFLDKEAPR